MEREMKRGANPQADPQESLSAAVPRNDAERRVLSHYSETMDFDGFRALQSKHLELRSKPAKYLDFTTWLRARFEIAETLGLTDSPPLKILDLGCGPSHFGLVCRVFGHNVVGEDLPGNALYNDLVAFFELRRVAEAIRPNSPLPAEIGTGFNLVTALSANFYQKEDGSLFTVEEWTFFFKALSNVLQPDGRVFFKLNPLQDHPGLHPEDAAFAHMVESLGGTANGVLVQFDRGLG
jgi:hypothetical protein